MRRIILVICLLTIGGCVGNQAISTNPRDECLQIGVEMAHTAKMLRTVSYIPAPETVDMLLEQASDFEQCMLDAKLDF